MLHDVGVLLGLHVVALVSVARHDVHSVEPLQYLAQALRAVVPWHTLQHLKLSVLIPCRNVHAHKDRRVLIHIAEVLLQPVQLLVGESVLVVPHAHNAFLVLAVLAGGVLIHHIVQHHIMHLTYII